MIRVAFDNLAEIQKVYDPVIVEKATFTTVGKLTDQSATAVSKAIRARYKISAKEVKDALQRRTIKRVGEHQGLLRYTGKRTSLSRFTSGGMKPTARSRPKVSSARGTRYGARVQLVRTRPARIIPGAFWGRARAGQGDEGLGQGAWQIWQRRSSRRDDIRRLTGPSIAHMARADESTKAIEQIVLTKADDILASRMDYYTRQRAGTL